MPVETLLQLKRKLSAVTTTDATSDAKGVEVIVRHDAGEESLCYENNAGNAIVRNHSKRFIPWALENPTGSEDMPWFFTPYAITVTEIRAVVKGSTPSITWTVRHHATDRSATGNEVVTGGTTTTSQTTGSDVTTFNDATIPADSYVWVETTAQSGTVDWLSLTMVYTTDA